MPFVVFMGILSLLPALVWYSRELQLWLGILILWIMFFNFFLPNHRNKLLIMWPCLVSRILLNTFNQKPGEQLKNPNKSLYICCKTSLFPSPASHNGQTRNSLNKNISICYPPLPQGSKLSFRMSISSFFSLHSSCIQMNFAI